MKQRFCDALSSGTEKEPKPKLFGPDIFQWGRGLPRERVGAKKFDTSLETREIKLFGRDIPGFCRDIPGAPEKFEKEKVWVQFSFPISKIRNPYTKQNHRNFQHCELHDAHHPRNSSGSSNRFDIHSGNFKHFELHDPQILCFQQAEHSRHLHQLELRSPGISRTKSWEFLAL